MRQGGGGGAGAQGPLDLLASPFSMPGQVLLEGPSSPSLQLHLDRATSATLARAGSANSARPALPEGTNRLGLLAFPLSAILHDSATLCRVGSFPRVDNRVLILLLWDSLQNVLGGECVLATLQRSLC